MFALALAIYYVPMAHQHAGSFFEHCSPVVCGTGLGTARCVSAANLIRYSAELSSAQNDTSPR
jgi:hypothetical protein